VSPKHPVATREHHDKFCETEGWELVRGATGPPVRHHRTYELTLWNAHVLRTRISRPVNGTTYSTSMWAHILKDQLAVSADEFWACVNTQVLPDRGEPETKAPKAALPLYLARALGQIGLPENEILDLTPVEAAQRLSQHYRALQNPKDA
jgi:hypothetical protein